MLRVDDNRREGMVLGSGPDHGRSTDIDVLDTGGKIRTASCGFFEGIKIDDDQVDGLDIIFGHFRFIAVIIATG